MPCKRKSNRSLHRPDEDVANPIYTVNILYDAVPSEFKTIFFSFALLAIATNGELLTQALACDRVSQRAPSISPASRHAGTDTN